MKRINNFIHTMQTQRITASIPTTLYQQMDELVAIGGRSKFVARAIKKEIVRIQTQGSPLDHFTNMVNDQSIKIPNLTTTKIKEYISRGRL
ncbi:hypothetical protein CO051_03685 [Candidatus Roizmanbacteria bacterium CG_4_9_14_0_2_um_filter_39_13]|uniref:Uncharacterized protein n=1 Tax=Candidatus Roizmanbacteria bacterium CG_4_9_14_0_2_um_filter_39_13 TaxID=1974839 RepID=A0A2M8EYW8_9BACT|nr:MAG: hypothetical protein CO051_03685 [Candidatus Roizmanbacteria bacterium CG_4_9_14_0_2_um_filter_39_13]